MTPIRRAYSGSPVAATAIAHGKLVASSNRIPMPVSASSDIKSGTFARDCIRLAMIVVSYNGAPKKMIPPTLFSTT